jgi:hypothetical protein
MLNFLREADREDGKPGPLSMRRISAAACFMAAIAAGILSILAIIKFIGANPDTSINWKAFIPIFIPCIAFLFGGLMLLFFTTWTDLKELVCSAVSLKK